MLSASLYSALSIGIRCKFVTISSFFILAVPKVKSISSVICSKKLFFTLKSVNGKENNISF